MVTQQKASWTPRRTTVPGGREAKAKVRREQVLAAALALFCERGYAATSTRRIAEAAGVTEGLVFHYFSTKEALLLELAARQHTFAGRVLGVLQQAGGGTARALLQAMAEGFSAVSAEERAFVGFMHAEAQVNPVLRKLVSAANAVVLGELVQVLRRRVDAGELRAEAALEVAVQGFFGGFLFFFSQHRHLGPTAWRREAAAFADAWADQCWRGLAVQPKQSSHSTTRIRKARS